MNSSSLLCLKSLLRETVFLSLFLPFFGNLLPTERERRDLYLSRIYPSLIYLCIVCTTYIYIYIDIYRPGRVSMCIEKTLVLDIDMCEEASSWYIYIYTWKLRKKNYLHAIPMEFQRRKRRRENNQPSPLPPLLYLLCKAMRKQGNWYPHLLPIYLCILTILASYLSIRMCLYFFFLLFLSFSSSHSCTFSLCHSFLHLLLVEAG